MCFPEFSTFGTSFDLGLRSANVFITSAKHSLVENSWHLKQVSMSDVFCGPLGTSFPRIVMEAQPWNSPAPFQIPSTSQTAGSGSTHSESLPGQRRVLEDHKNPRGKRQGTLTYGIAGMLVACNTARNIDSHDTLLTSRNNPVSNQVPKSTTSSAEQSRGEVTVPSKRNVHVLDPG